MFRDLATGFHAGPTLDLVGVHYADMADSSCVGNYGLIGLRASLPKDRWEFYAEARDLDVRKYASAIASQTQVSTAVYGSALQLVPRFAPHQLLMEHLQRFFT